MIIHDDLGVRGEYNVLSKGQLKPGEVAREFMDIKGDRLKDNNIRRLVVNPDGRDSEGFYHHKTSSIIVRNRNNLLASVYISSDEEPNLQEAVRAFENAGLGLKGMEI